MNFSAKIFGFFVIGLFSFKSFATCPPILPCKPTGEASTIAGSNADTELIVFTQNITKSTNEVAAALIDMANANASSLNQGAQSVIAAQIELSQIQANQDLKIKRAMADRDMAHASQMMENINREANSVISADDTKEEFELILDYLRKNSDMSVPEIILLMQETVDKSVDLGFVLIQIKSSKGVCEKKDVDEGGQCSIAKRVYPAKKLQALYNQCSLEKITLIEAEKRNQAKVMSIELANKSTSEALETTNSTGALSKRINSQINLSCTPTQYKNNLCGDMSPEDYQEKIVSGQIIPNGDVSASNFSSPTSISSHGYIDDFDPSTKDQIEGASLNRQSIKDNPNQKVVRFNHTYRNANQVKSALNFIDNLVADDLIPALSPTDRRKVQNAEYQSRFLNRVASLSMVRLVLSESMSARVGDEMRNMILSGEMDRSDSFEISLTSDANKESVSGAGVLDILESRVNEQSQRLTVKENGGSEFISAPSDAKALDGILSSVQLQNEMLMKEYLMLEQMNSLKAIAISQKINSPRVTELMKDLRSGR